VYWVGGWTGIGGVRLVKRVLGGWMGRGREVSETCVKYGTNFHA